MPLNAGASRRGYHRLTDYDFCMQYGAYRHELHIVAQREVPELALGGLLHLGLAYHYERMAGRSQVDPIEAIREAPARVVWQFERAREILLAYFAYYKKEPFTVLDVEREFEVRLDDEHIHTFRLDTLVLWNGRAVNLEHKSAARPDASVRRYETSGQILIANKAGPLLMGPIYGVPWGGTAVNIIGTGKDLEFRRVWLRLDPVLAEHKARAALWTNRKITQAQREAGSPWNMPKNGPCVDMRGRICPFLRLCEIGPAGLSEYRQVVDRITDIEPDGG